MALISYNYRFRNFVWSAFIFCPYTRTGGWPAIHSTRQWSASPADFVRKISGPRHSSSVRSHSRAGTFASFPGAGLRWYTALLLIACFAVLVPPLRADGAPHVPQAQGEQIIRGIDFIGNRRVPVETLRGRLTSLHVGDIYDPQNAERDFMALWNTGYFEDVRIEKEDVAGATPGVVLHIYVKEKPIVGEIKYVGLNAVSQSDLLDEYKKRHFSFTQESPYDPTKLKRAEVVIKEILAEHGRQFATVRAEVRQLGVNRVAVSFVIKEGPKVKVGRISFEGNKNVSSRTLMSGMKGLAPIGLPHSIILEHIWARTYDPNRLAEDAERVRDLLQQRGYFRAVVEDPKTTVRDTGGGVRIPFVHGGKGKVVDIHIGIQEGEKYRLAAIKFSGMNILNDKQARPLFPIKDGDTFNIQRIRDGLKNMRDAYGHFGYINFTPSPRTDIDEANHTLTVTIEVDEGKQYYVRRIEFQGNTTTRDKVIRRELAVDEGGIYDQKLWEFSLLRLNQLGFFEKLDPEKDTQVTKDDKNAQVDLTLKVKEKQKNSIGVNGGVSGLAGSFIGINYETNNFLGLGETLSISAQIGNLQRVVQFGFTQPYLFDRPIQFGFTVFSSRYNYNQAQQLNLLSGQKINIPQSELNLLQNFAQNSTGFTTSVSYAFMRSLKRVGLTYSLNRSTITAFSTLSQQFFQELQFRRISGPNALSGIVTSSITPTFSYSNVNGTFNPASGRSIVTAVEFAGLGGNVRSIRPLVDFKQFIPMHGFLPLARGTQAGARHHVLAMHFQGAFITGWGGLGPSPFSRFWLGGDNDIRGFDIRSVSPIVYIADKVNQPLLSPSDPCINNPNTTCPTPGFGIPVDPTNPRKGFVTVPVQIQRLFTTAGGDTEGVFNLEYRIPIISDRVVLAPFTDVGVLGILRPSQMRIAADQLNQLNTTLFGCPFLDPSQTNGCGGGTVPNPLIPADVKILNYSNFYPRMSTGLELQIMMPVVNAPFRLYYAYNPLRLDKTTTSPGSITRSMFPPGGAGDITFLQTQSIYAPGYILSEPKKTFRFSVSTTF